MRVQTVGNACGTVGLTHAALNLADKLELADGSFFANFLSTTKSLDADARAQALDDNQAIGEEHESIASAGVTDASEAMHTNRQTPTSTQRRAHGLVPWATR